MGRGRGVRGTYLSERGALSMSKICRDKQTQDGAWDSMHQTRPVPENHRLLSGGSDAENRNSVNLQGLEEHGNNTSNIFGPLGPLTTSRSISPRSRLKSCTLIDRPLSAQIVAVNVAHTCNQSVSNCYHLALG